MSKQFFRTNQVFIHHLFRLVTAKMLKNAAWGKNVDLIKLDHEHIFHSCNSAGQPQTTCSPVGGHYHEVKWTKDKGGNLKAEAGPALRKVVKIVRGAQKTTIEPVRFPDGTIDEHSHDVEYRGSDELTPQKIQEIQRANAVAVSAVSEPQAGETEMTENDS